MVKPIKPDEVVDKMEAQFPEFLIEAVNQLIAKNWTGGSATFRVSELTRQINDNREADSLPITNYPTNFEPVFRKAGWKVNRDSPAYCESYETNWTFTKA